MEVGFITLQMVPGTKKGGIPKMTDFQLFILGIQKMPWLLVIPIVTALIALVEAVERKWERRMKRGKKTMEEATNRKVFKRICN